MKRYYQAMLQNDIPPGQSENVNYVSEASVQNCQQIREEVDVDKLPIDPAKRKMLKERIEFPTGKGLNQEATLKRAGDTRWGSYYTTLLSLIRLFNPVIGVLEHIIEHTEDHDLRDGWDSFLQEVTLFCESHNIAVVDMSSSFVDPRRVLRKSENMKSRRGVL
ncbi:hypothetical protein POM88_046133 [Heracleum sosnowskyi]|uniref:Uncharacterized protein n=1 Tax=Heracleum sosnowskyi TaxID=360622 RepID=A0AAD8H709_9APIA|nr:hypothetical protein POM88_046133 [Heracleum sosnowskyi]